MRLQLAEKLAVSYGFSGKESLRRSQHVLQSGGNAMSAAYPVHIASPAGLRMQVHAHGSIRRMDYHDILLNLFLGNELEEGPSNIYLRRHAASIAATPLLGLHSPAVFQIDEQGLTARGMHCICASTYSTVRPAACCSHTTSRSTVTTAPRRCLRSA